MNFSSPEFFLLLPALALAIPLGAIVAQVLKHVDVCKELLSEIECLLPRIGERRNVAVFHPPFQLLVLG